MDIEEVKQFLDENKELPEVAQLVEQLADRRVNQALSKWNAELPGKIENAIHDRKQRDEERRSKVEQVRSQINNKLAEAKIEQQWIEPFLPEDLEPFADNEEQFQGFMEKTIGTVQTMRESFLKEKYSTHPPIGGGLQKEVNPEQEFFDRARASALKG